MAGDALDTANRSRQSAASEEEDDGDGGSTGRPASCGLMGSFRARGRSSCACRGGEGRPVAAAMANGGDRRVRTRERESEGEERKNRVGEKEESGRELWTCYFALAEEPPLRLRPLYTPLGAGLTCPNDGGEHSRG